MSIAALWACLQWVRAQTAPETVESRVKQFGTSVQQRLTADFLRAGVSYPPARMLLVGLKQERSLELYARGAGEPWKRIRAYPIQAASGHLGPKLREGDWQVPEGFYRIEYLNPNSLFHLSMKLDYPNAFDRQWGAKEGRKKLGGDIMIHGKDASIGCLAMGDAAAEEIFVLAALTGIRNVSVILSPVDFRKQPLSKVKLEGQHIPPWMTPLYQQIETALADLKSGD